MSRSYVAALAIVGLGLWLLPKAESVDGPPLISKEAIEALSPPSADYSPGDGIREVGTKGGKNDSYAKHWNCIARADVSTFRTESTRVPQGRGFATVRTQVRTDTASSRLAKEERCPPLK